MNRATCSQLRKQLQEVKSLKGYFDVEVVNIKDTRNTALALVLEEKIREKIKLIQETLFLAPFEWAEMTVGNKSKEVIIQELNKRADSDNPEEKIYIDNNALDMINEPEFVISEKVETIKLVRLKVSDLGFPHGANFINIRRRASELGLEICPPEVGPCLIANYKKYFDQEQPRGDLFYVMREVYIDDFYTRSFTVSRDSEDNKCWLREGFFTTRAERFPTDELVFRARQLEN